MNKNLPHISTLSSPDTKETLVQLKLEIAFFFSLTIQLSKTSFPIPKANEEKKIKHSKCLDMKLNYSHTITSHIKIIYFLVFLPQ